MELLERIVDAEGLHEWVSNYAGLTVPRRAVCPHHQSPFEYLCSSYFEPARDQIVWAPRGGGKTSLAAVATLLDMLHKPGISLRILGGSLDQSLRMWEYLLGHFSSGRLPDDLIENPKSTARRLLLTNQSSAAVLTQSQRSVRGVRVQKMRCDEVEMFDPAVWSAAQLTTRSTVLDGMETRGAVEALSTMHLSHGLMSDLIDQAPQTGTKLVKWCLLEVLEKCPLERECASCALWDECRGIAKTRCDGFVTIDDAIVMKGRVSRETWVSEMLCRRPSREGAVFPMLDANVHFVPVPPFAMDDQCDWWLGMDFGFSAPLVCLWIVRRGEMVYVIDEHVKEGMTLGQHLEVIGSREWKPARWVACDPAGSSRNEQTARSNIDLLHAHGYRVKTRGSRIVDGIELIRAALKSASNQTRLFIHPRCVRLIRSMENYHYKDKTSELPEKDGTHDHAVDALRYFFINTECSPIRSRRY